MNSKQMRMSIVGVCALVGMVLHSSAIAQCNPQEVAKLLASDGAMGDSFGGAVSMSGGTILVGAIGDDDRGEGSGSVYVYERSNGAWTRVAKLTAFDGAQGDNFGWRVCMSNGTAVVGALYDDDLGNASGSAYVFERVGGAWTHVAKLRASDGAEGNLFGSSVSVSGATVVVGAFGNYNHGEPTGSAYVYEKIAGVWTEVAKLVASDGASLDNFGISVSVSGDTAVVGAWQDDDLGSASGSAYVFERAGGVWTQTAKLMASDGVAGDAFGGSVSVVDDSILIGARADANSSGSAYVFERIGDVWSQVAKLTSSDGAAGDSFGTSVSRDGDTVMVGASERDDRGESSGSAYVFKKIGQNWRQAAKITASDGMAWDYFGWGVSISGGTAIVGAWGDDELGENSGSAYVFDLHCGPQLSANATCPSGGPIQVSWSGATGGGTIVLLYARNNGSFRIPNGNPCEGTQLGLGSNQIQIAYQGAAGSNGSRTVNANAGPGACGGYLQLLDLTTCGTSNVARID